MKKVLVYVSLLILITLIGIYSYKKKLIVPESTEEIQARRMKTFETRIKEFEDSNSGKIYLSKTINIRWKIIQFKPENHKIEYCENKKLEKKYICKIDDEEWFGSDFKNDFPKNKLKSMALYINGKYIELEISQMFNPNFSGNLDESQFKLKQFKDHYILYGFFADGAGSYTAHWKIKNGVSKRIVLSQEDEDFEWQNL